MEIEEASVTIQGEPSVIPTDPLPTKDEVTKKKTISYVFDIDLEKQGDRKKLKVDTGNEIIDSERDRENNHEIEMPITFIEEENTQEIVVSNPKEPKKTSEELVLKLKDYSYATASKGQFKRENE